MSYFGSDTSEPMTTLEAKKLLGAVVRFEVDDAPMRSKAELERLAELDHQEYLRTLDRVCDNLLRASKPDPNEGLINLYAERTRKKKTIEVYADCPKDGDFNSLNLYEERVNK